MNVQRNKIRASSWAEIYLVHERSTTKKRTSHFASECRVFDNTLQTANSKAEEIQGKWILASAVSMYDIDVNRKYDQILEEVFGVLLEAEAGAPEAPLHYIQLSI